MLTEPNKEITKMPSLILNVKHVVLRLKTKAQLRSDTVKIPHTGDKASLDRCGW